jgi:hypothetical protein
MYAVGSVQAFTHMPVLGGHMCTLRHTHVAASHPSNVATASRLRVRVTVKAYMDAMRGAALSDFDVAQGEMRLIDVDDNDQEKLPLVSATATFARRTELFAICHVKISFLTWLATVMFQVVRIELPDRDQALNRRTGSAHHSGSVPYTGSVTSSCEIVTLATTFFASIKWVVDSFVALLYLWHCCVCYCQMHTC